MRAGLCAGAISQHRECVLAEKSKLYRVYTVVPRPKQDDYWLNVGAAFPHDDGKGWNILLQALPLPHDGQCKLVIREYVPKPGETAEAATPPTK